MLLKTIYVLNICVIFGSAITIDNSEYSKTFHSGAIAEDTLILSHVIFRHGDRTPDSVADYPTDPYINKTYFPYGRGQLTLTGKRRAFTMGAQLYRRYKGFLGPIYYPQLLEATASESTRTHMSLQSALAALFPPQKQNRIAHIDWQPIPYTYLKKEVDNMINTMAMCPITLPKDNEKINGIAEENRDLLEYLSIYTGINNISLFDIITVQDNLLTNEQFGLPVPKWAKPIWPYLLTTAAQEVWKILVDDYPKVLAGNLFKKIVNDTTAKMYNNIALRSRKLILYSGHDITVSPILGILGNYERRPPYSAYVIIELHQIGGVYGIKAFYQDYGKIYPRLITIPNCKTFCPWDQFVTLTKKYIPGEDWCKYE